MPKGKNSRNMETEIEVKKILDKAQEAEDEGRLSDAINFYNIASKLSLKNGEFELAKNLSDKISQIKKRQFKVEMKFKAEKDRIKTSDQIEILEKQIAKVLEIAEIAISEQRWNDASKYYSLASNYAAEMGDKDRSNALKLKAEELRKMVYK